jgi:protein-S-isoprenylcysteine O-methyltransferase Ste14
MPDVGTWFSILWIGWFVGWWLPVFTAARTIQRQSLASRLRHSLLMALGAALILFHPRPLAALFRPIFVEAIPIIWAGLVLTALGLGYSVWARVYLGRFWSAAVTLKEEHQLIRGGPYGTTRHPIYTGLLLALFGTALARGTWGDLLGLVLIVIGLMIKIRQEERLLTGHFGAAYDTYRADVPMLIPLVH